MSDIPGYRENPEALAELEYDGTTWSTENIVRLLRSRSCAPGLLWVGQDWGDDHGHTDCWVHGLAATRLQELEDKLARIRDAK